MCAVRRQTYKGYVKTSHFFITSSEKCDARLSPRITTFPSSRRQYGTATDVNQSVKQTLSNQHDLDLLYLARNYTNHSLPGTFSLNRGTYLPRTVKYCFTNILTWSTSNGNPQSPSRAIFCAIILSSIG